MIRLPFPLQGPPAQTTTHPSRLVPTESIDMAKVKADAQAFYDALAKLPPFILRIVAHPDLCAELERATKEAWKESGITIPVRALPFLVPGDAFAEFSDGSIRRIAGKPGPAATTEEWL